MAKSDQNEDKLECLGFWSKHALFIDALDWIRGEEDNPIERIFKEKCFLKQEDIDALYEVIDQAERQARKLTAECVKSACDIIKKFGLKYKEPSSRGNRDAWKCGTVVWNSGKMPVKCNIFVGCEIDTDKNPPDGNLLFIYPFVWVRDKHLANVGTISKIKVDPDYSDVQENDDGGTTLVLKKIRLVPDKNFGLKRADILGEFKTIFEPQVQKVIVKAIGRISSHPKE